MRAGREDTEVDLILATSYLDAHRHVTRPVRRLPGPGSLKEPARTWRTRNLRARASTISILPWHASVKTSACAP